MDYLAEASPDDSALPVLAGAAIRVGLPVEGDGQQVVDSEVVSARELGLIAAASLSDQPRPDAIDSQSASHPRVSSTGLSIPATDPAAGVTSAECSIWHASENVSVDQIGLMRAFAADVNFLSDTQIGDTQPLEGESASTITPLVAFGQGPLPPTGHAVAPPVIQFLTEATEVDLSEADELDGGTVILPQIIQSEVPRSANDAYVGNDDAGASIVGCEGQLPMVVSGAAAAQTGEPVGTLGARDLTPPACAVAAATITRESNSAASPMSEGLGTDQRQCSGNSDGTTRGPDGACFHRRDLICFLSDEDGTEDTDSNESRARRAFLGDTTDDVVDCEAEVSRRFLTSQDFEVSSPSDSTERQDLLSSHPGHESSRETQRTFLSDTPETDSEMVHPVMFLSDSEGEPQDAVVRPPRSFLSDHLDSFPRDSIE
jgi:hypothetical protein